MVRFFTIMCLYKIYLNTVHPSNPIGLRVWTYSLFISSQASSFDKEHVEFCKTLISDWHLRV